ncbi:MAG: tetratricopeptide repeat protein [Saprospiraceae bacterium]|nr:tetratricopeptide repeat protein [Saprospiraceae bacterium]
MSQNQLSTNSMLDNSNYTEETKPLFKLFKTEAFRFVVVRYNHYSFVQQLQKDLKTRFSDRPCHIANAKDIDYTQLMKDYLGLGRGFFILEGFDDVLKEDKVDKNSRPEVAANNYRRKDITIGLNLRRDKLAQHPIALIVCVPASADALYAKIMIKKMPDLWSFRSWMLDIEGEISQELVKNPFNTEGVSSLPKEAIEIESDADFLTQKQKELTRLRASLANTPDNEIEYRLTLYPQVVDVEIEIGDYQSALDTLDAWETVAFEDNKDEIWLKKGDVLTTIGKIEQALLLFEKAKDAYTKADNKENLAVSLSRIGNTHAALGNLDKALQFYEDYSKLEKQLYESYPNNVSFKNGLAISYQYLGYTHAALGNLDKALQFYEDDAELTKQLYESYPNNVEFKNNLAISYSKLGETHAALGNLDKALQFYEDDAELTKQLYESYPNNVEFKNNLAISYSKLGSTHAALGNLDKALQFYEDYSKLEKQLYESYPNNVEFKNGLAISYAKLGVFSRDAIKDKTKARLYFKQAETLWLELVRDAPQYVEFQKFLGMVQEILKDL